MTKKARTKEKFEQFPLALKLSQREKQVENVKNAKKINFKFKTKFC